MTIWEQGRWQAKNGDFYDQEEGVFRNNAGGKIRPPRVLGITGLWSIYSPQTSWPQIVRDYRAAVAKAKHGERSDLKTWINTTLGEVFEDDIEKTDAGDLQKRAEDFPLQIVPMGGLILLAGIDVQKDRFELTVWAFGRGEEMWSVDYQAIEANPAIQTEWQKLDNFLLHKYPHAAGTNLQIEHVAIDTGGHYTHQSYIYVRERKSTSGWSINTQYAPQVYASKGSSTMNLPIVNRGKLMDVSIGDKLVKNGVKLYMIGTDTAKNTIHGRLQVAEHGPGFVHLSKYLPAAFFEHLTAEVRVMKQSPKGTVSSWVLKRSGIRNEALDCTVMTLFCAAKIALHRKSAAEWQTMENIVQPHQVDIFNIQPGLTADGVEGQLIHHGTGINLSSWGRS
jgi:phage terminase large subunit GpA-like protein